jgi:hypothetical protein
VKKGDTAMSNENESEEQKRKQHIREMKEQLRQHNGGVEPAYGCNFPNSKMEEKFLEQILFMEGANEQPLFDILKQNGVQLPKPKVLDDEHLHDKLWEIINNMARLGCYLSSTDHLSDRQLYEVLWKDILREPTSVCPDDPTVSCNIDILGGCSEEDMLLRLKYYADEDERLDWADEYPDDSIPPHESLPYDRDRHLPAPPYGQAGMRDC